MIDKIMTEINNHFARTVEQKTYEIVSDGIVGTFAEKYIVGQYVWIRRSFLNDGVYKISSITSSKLTFVETDLQPENTGETVWLFALTPPRSFLTLVNDIETYIAAIPAAQKGIKSESQGSRSISYGSGASGNGSNDWQSIFSQDLNDYRRMYDDDESSSNLKYGWQNRLGCW